MILTKIRYFLTIPALVILLGIGACSKLCNSGYEGNRCNVLTTAKFTGQWAATDSPGNVTYIDTILQGKVINDITLSTSFSGHHFAHVINASVLSDQVTIASQQPDSGKDYVQGSGTLSSDNKTISFSYQIISGPDSPRITTNYSGTWVKQN